MTDGEPKWAVVLRAIYENKMAGKDFVDLGYTGLSRRIAIARGAGLEPIEASRVIHKLVDQGLITDINPSDQFQGYMLTEKGFDVAHTRSLRRQERRREQQRNKRQHDVNRAIGFLTIGLLFTGSLQPLIAALVGEEARLLFINGALLLGSVVVIGITVLLWKFGMLAPWDSNDRDEDRTDNMNGNEDEDDVADDENKTEEIPEDKDADVDESDSNEDEESESAETAIDDSEKAGE